VDKLDREIHSKKIEVDTLTRLLDNARRDLRALENQKKAEAKKNAAKMQQ
jgi:hypothetical protein